MEGDGNEKSVSFCECEMGMGVRVLTGWKSMAACAVPCMKEGVFVGTPCLSSTG